MTRNSGFTLIELVVAVAVAGILLALAIPSFTSSVKQNQSVTDANVVLTMLDLARSEAVKHDQTVTVCKSADGSSCDTGGSTTWDEGYLIYYTPVGGAQTTLKAQIPLSTASTITATNFASSISFNGLGSAGTVVPPFTANTGFFTVTPKSLQSSQRSFIRCVSVYQSGRLYIKNPNSSTFVCS